MYEILWIQKIISEIFYMGEKTSASQQKHESCMIYKWPFAFSIGFISLTLLEHLCCLTSCWIILKGSYPRTMSNEISQQSYIINNFWICSMMMLNPRSYSTALRSDIIHTEFLINFTYITIILIVIFISSSGMTMMMTMTMIKLSEK